MAKTPGSVWIQGNDFYFVDTAQRVWKWTGIFVKNISAGPKPGSFWSGVGTGFLFYVNQAGTAVYRTDGPWESRYGGAPNSIWVGLDNKFRWTSSNAGVVNLHQDVAHVDTGTTTHTNVAHTDVPANIAHVDVAHSNVHTDTAHSNSHTDSHTDTPGTNFGDHVDCNSDYLGQDGGLYYWYLNCASTPYAGSDPNPYGPIHSNHTNSSTDPGGGYMHDDRGVHWDFAHTNVHSNVAHSNVAHKNSHSNVAHTNTHTDTPHNDVAHSDHSDTVHSDTSHTDNPVIVG